MVSDRFFNLHSSKEECIAFRTLFNPSLTSLVKCNRFYAKTISQNKDMTLPSCTIPSLVPRDKNVYLPPTLTLSLNVYTGWQTGFWDTLQDICTLAELYFCPATRHSTTPQFLLILCKHIREVSGLTFLTLLIVFQSPIYMEKQGTQHFGRNLKTKRHS